MERTASSTTCVRDTAVFSAQVKLTCSCWSATCDRSSRRTSCQQAFYGSHLDGVLFASGLGTSKRRSREHIVGKAEVNGFLRREPPVLAVGSLLDFLADKTDRAARMFFRLSQRLREKPTRSSMAWTVPVVPPETAWMSTRALAPMRRLSPACSRMPPIEAAMPTQMMVT